MKNKKSKKYILWFKDISNKDVALVGGKNASLGEMYSELSKKGVNIPNGFAITAEAYKYFIKYNKLEDNIKKELKGIKIKKVETRHASSLQMLNKHSANIRRLISNGKMPKDLEIKILNAYHKFGRTEDVAVRSSATAEDLPDASFAGQQETYLNVVGRQELIQAVKKCFASLFTARAIVYRQEKKFNHFKIFLSVGVQKMVRADLASSGVIFSIDTESGFQNVVMINSIYGLGENIVQGKVNPDEFYVFKPMLAKKKNAIISKTLGDKKIKLIYKGDDTKNVPVKEDDQYKFSLSNKEVLQLAKWTVLIEKHYDKPMDIEWAKDGKNNKLYIVQARPETVHSQKNLNILEEYKIQKNKKSKNQENKIICTGKAVGSKIGQGKANIIMDVKSINKFRPGEVLVTEMTDPDWVPVMKIASAIVTNSGGRTCFTSDTKILTNKGFLKFKEIPGELVENKLYTLSFNRNSLKLEWKKIEAVQKRLAQPIQIEISQTGKMKGNFLRLTPDHKMITFKERRLIDKKIEDIIESKEMICSVDSIPEYNQKESDKRLGYLMGALMTDGSFYLSKTHGEVQFIQKNIPEKHGFINKVKDNFEYLFDYTPREYVKKASSAAIRGRQVIGQATAYRVYNKSIATQLINEKENIVTTLLQAPEEFVWHYLAGIIDGDGAYSEKAGRINIFCTQKLLPPVMIGCLRLGIFPQVVKNRSIFNVQIVDKIEEIFQYTQRVKGEYKSRQKFGTRFFAAKQILDDIINKANYKGRIKPYVKNNLIIDAEKIKLNILPLLNKKEKTELEKIVNSKLRMLRIKRDKNLSQTEVYNITVKDNHNYLVFTDRYTPILVNNCHAAIVSRELGVPCIVGTGNATEKIDNQDNITVSCAEGEVGKVYSGLVSYKIKKVNLKKVRKPKVDIMLNIGEPERAFEFSFIPNDGVGLARQEFIINNAIKIHPLALLNYDKLAYPPSLLAPSALSPSQTKSRSELRRTGSKIKKQIDEMTRGYKYKTDFYVEKLSEGIARIGAAFYPKDVIVRLSDFKSDEYRNLLGGEFFEPEEDNPMLGWRGASRFYDPVFRPAFDLECQALKKVRNKMGLDNIKIMIPFCRTVEEGQKVLSIMSENGLVRAKNNLEVYVMIEIPSNIILADEFAKIFDGFSIGSNDLTMLTLGLDRNSAQIAKVGNEKNEAVKKLISQVIKIAKKHKKKIGICGQAPSDFPDFAEFLVKEGIDSISLNPDSVIKTIRRLSSKR